MLAKELKPAHALRLGPGDWTWELLLRENFPQFNDKIIQLCNYIDAPKIWALAKDTPQEITDEKQKGRLILATSARMNKEKGYVGQND